ncbi:MAG: sulfur carrier protein ThiS [Phenylobacterium sp.]|nr:sulfur carrier protein ThiS [Phenylobacterium sp.]
MSLVLNGESRVMESVRTVAELVVALGLDARKVAVERNLEIVPRSLYDRTELAIVHFIGGG